MISARALTLLACVGACAACRETSKADAAQLRRLGSERKQELASRLALADSDPKRTAPVAMWLLPPELKEISGIALTADGRLLAHDDNVGRIFVIDPRSGLAVKQFVLGRGVQGDFEAITVAGSDIYLLDSNGTLYQFREGADGSAVPFAVHDTHLGHECEFESLAYQADSGWLVMPCKKVGKKQLQDQLVIYRWRVAGPDSTRLSMATIPLARLIGSNRWKDFRPSDMTIDPTTGNYVLIASHENGLVEMTPAGEAVRSGPLPGEHSQPEGVAITKDSILIISDETGRRPAAITLYRWRR